jgi:hypothetical protein
VSERQTGPTRFALVDLFLQKVGLPSYEVTSFSFCKVPSYVCSPIRRHQPSKPLAAPHGHFDTTVLGIRESMRYSPVVKLRSLSLVLLAGVALLSMQMAGIHLHAGEPSGDVGAHGAHMHNVETDGHDHSNAVDVTVVDLGTVWSKLMPVLLTAFPTILAIVWLLHTLWPPPIALIPLRRRSRWRPPLRAPPLSP